MKKVITILVSIAVMVCISELNAQNFIVQAGEIHTGNGQVHKDKLMLVENGIIVSIADTMPSGYNYFSRINAKNRKVYPALIALNSQLGIKEIDAVRATSDYREVGKYNPNARTIIAYNTDSEVVKTVASGGVLFAQVCPQGGRISGKSSLVKLSGWNWEDATILSDDGIHLNWPRDYNGRGWWAALKADKKNNKYVQEVEELNVFFERASAFYETIDEEVSLKYQAIGEVLDGERNLYIHIKEAEPMMDALEFCKKWNISPIFYGASDAWKIAPLLKKAKAKIVIIRSKSLPARIDESITKPYELAKTLSDNEIEFAIADKGSWQQRNLSYQAAQAVAYGLDYNEAIKSITLIPAKIMGVDKTRGSLELGKKADFIIVEGDLLEIKESFVHRAYIDGKQIKLDDKQKALYEKYKEKYKID